MENARPRRPVPWPVLLALSAAGCLISYRLGASSRRSAAAVPETCAPPGVRADPAAVEAFFKAWNDPAARGGISPSAPSEVVLAEAVRLVLFSEQEGFAGFNAYLNKSALPFSEAEIGGIGEKLSNGKLEERLAAFRAIVRSDLKGALLVDAVLADPRIASPPAPPPDPPAEDPSEPPPE